MKFLLPLLIATAPLMAAGNGEIARLEAMSDTFASVADRATPAVVFIEVEGRVDRSQVADPMEQMQNEFFRRFFGAPPQQQEQVPVRGAGSGFLVSADGYILTNNHIVGPADTIKVRMRDGREYMAELIGTDPQTDVAVIKIEGENFPYLKLADSSGARVGDWAIAVGSPFGLEATVTLGIISAMGRSDLHITEFDNFIQTDAAINPGNSGGPLLNLHGEAVGVNTAIIHAGGAGYLGIGFAIPSNMAKRVMEQLIDGGSVTRGYLGTRLQPVNQDLAIALGLDRPTGALITDVMPDSPAQKAGLEAGDVIVEFEGIAIESPGALQSHVSMIDPGQRVSFKVIRDGKTMTKRAKLAKRPGPTTGKEGLGIEVQPLDDQLAQQYNYAGESGVVVKRTEMGSAAYKAGIRPGTLIVRVNRTPIKTPEEFYKAVEEAEGDKVLLLVRQGQSMRFVTLPKQ